MTSPLFANLVGQQFAAGAAFAASLPAETKVYLVREPSNPYDPNAIQVWIERNEALDALGPKPSAINGDFIRLGYIRREQAADYAPEFIKRGVDLVEGILAYESLITFELPPAPEPAEPTPPEEE